MLKQQQCPKKERNLFACFASFFKVFKKGDDGAANAEAKEIMREKLTPQGNQVYLKITHFPLGDTQPTRFALLECH